jgi:nucleoside-diphosphate-sugar epimerase
MLRRLSGEQSVDAVVALARRPPQLVPPYDLASWHAVDLTQPDAEPALDTACTDADAVIHLAWELDPNRTGPAALSVAVDGTRSVLAAALRCGIGQLVHVSSAAVYLPVPRKGDRSIRADEGWPIGGVPSSAYSQSKVQVEMLLDGAAAAGADLAVARARPVGIVQRAAAGQLARYALGRRARLSRLVFNTPALPVSRHLRLQLVHADDVADALWRMVASGLRGPVNLAAEPMLGPADVAAAFGTRAVLVPDQLARAALWSSWRAGLQPLEPGWLDMATSLPLLDTTRARKELGWEPAYDSRAALDDLVAGVAENAGAPTDRLRPLPGA